MERNIITARDTIVHRSGILQLGLLDLVSMRTKEIIASDRCYLNELKQEQALSESGSLFIHRRRGKVNFGYFDSDSRNETGITKDIDLTYRLARRDFLDRKIASLEADIRRMQRLQNSSANAKERLRFNKRLKRFDDAALDLTRILFSEEQNQWIDANVIRNPFHRENLRFTTGCGLLVRSKSELSIAKFLETFGIPYRYDDLVELHSHHYRKPPDRDSYFADFKIPNLLGGVTIHEHFGAFQIENYAANALKRLNDYHSFTISELPGRPLKSSEITWSFESDLDSNESLEHVLLEVLLPM